MPVHAIRVLRQGAGRAVTGVNRLAILFDYLHRSDMNNDTINALAMALTRREEAPRALTRNHVDAFVRRLADELLKQIRSRSFKIKFRNTLSAIAGLFRWRVCEPYALLAARDPIAHSLRDTLLQARNLLGQPKLPVPQREQKLAHVDAIIAYLDGGGDPDILRMIEGGEEDEADE